MGDFSGWNPASHPMRRRADGCWFIEVQLPHGHNRYQFLVDGKPVLDPRGTGMARDERYERVFSSGGELIDLLGNIYTTCSVCMDAVPKDFGGARKQNQ